MPEKINKLIKLEYIFVFAILVIAFILRIYRVGEILGFYYDQGRDALVLWDLIHLPHKFFLIGPTTGLAGVFRGPFYYYLIAPFYWIGQGNPIYPEIFLAILSCVALFLMYLIAKELGGRMVGFISLILGTFSFEIIYASRWLSNPTPMLFLSMALVWCLFRILDGNKKYWIYLSFILGCSFFHFGSSGELFYFLAVAIFSFVYKKFPDIKTFFISLGVFLLTFSPLFIFNLKHGGILQNNVGGILTGDKSFGVPTWQFALDRISLVYVYFSSIIFHSPYAKEKFFVIMLSVLFFVFLLQLIKNQKIKVILILIMSVLFGLVFFQGNHGNLYQYYLTGYYLIFLLLVSTIFGKVYEYNWVGKFFVIYFLLYFISQNWGWIKPYINTTGQEPNMIVFSNQQKAIDWVYKNAGDRDFNVDVYVPPVIPYAYDYLFKWYGTTKYHKLSSNSQVQLLYTLYEDNPEHPERLQAWLSRQKGIGGIIKEHTFGGITVQERTRIINK